MLQENYQQPEEEGYRKIEFEDLKEMPSYEGSAKVKKLEYENEVMKNIREKIIAKLNLNLQENATKEEIFSEKNREALIAKLKLKENSTWVDIVNKL